MRLGLRHGRGYPQWVSETPVIDVVRTVIGVASVLIGSYAALFPILALQAAPEGQPPRTRCSSSPSRWPTAPLTPCAT